MGKFMYQGMEYGERYIKKHMRYSATVNRLYMTLEHVSQTERNVS